MQKYLYRLIEFNLLKTPKTRRSTHHQTVAAKCSLLSGSNSQIVETMNFRPAANHRLPANPAFDLDIQPPAIPIF